MTPRTVRKAERAAHLFWALILILSAYGVLPSWGDWAVRWVVVPAMAASGFAMWFAAPLRKLLRGPRLVVGRHTSRRSAMRARTRASSSSRIGRTSASVFPAGSSSSQSS
jgi:hypothetical protein